MKTKTYRPITERILNRKNSFSISTVNYLMLNSMNWKNQMNDDPFMNDAMEGLQQLENKNNIPFLVQDLNKSLKKQLRKKNKRKNKRAFKEQPWIYLSAIILLTLIVIAYLVIRNYNR